MTIKSVLAYISATVAAPMNPFGLMTSKRKTYPQAHTVRTGAAQAKRLAAKRARSRR